MKRLVEKQNLCIVNGESNICEGWTREQGEEKSVIDYVITTKKDLNIYNKTMKIHEEIEFEIYKVEIQGTKQCRKIYSDDNAIMLNIDFISKMEAKGKKKTITGKGY